MHKIEAIILRCQEIRETSLILTALSPELGKIRGVVKGIRGARAAVPWYIEPLTLQAMVFYERRRSNVGLISACDLLEAFDPIRRDFTRLSFAGFCLELVETMTERGEGQREVFNLLLNVLRSLESSQDPRAVVHYLEVHLLKANGLLPNPEALQLSPGGRLSLEQILRAPSERLMRLHLSRAVEMELRAKLSFLIQNVLERPLKSEAFLEAVFPSESMGLGREGAGPVPCSDSPRPFSRQYGKGLRNCARQPTQPPPDIRGQRVSA